MAGPGAVAAEAALARLGERMRVAEGAGRAALTAQADRRRPGVRLFPYREAFSQELAEREVAEGTGTVLDPFSGAGTTVLAACAAGRPSIGIEAMPVGITITRTILALGRGVAPEALRHAAARCALAMDDEDTGPIPIPPSRITAGAYPPDTHRALERARGHLARREAAGEPLAAVLRGLLLGVLEGLSLTRKDGQFLRWDVRRPGGVASGIDKGFLDRASNAVEGIADRAANDVAPLGQRLGAGPAPALVEGSCLEALASVPDASVSAVVTSPPYANRYDYTRTYALELAWLGCGEPELKALRQRMLCATVESRGKGAWLDARLAPGSPGARALAAVRTDAVLAEALQALGERRASLGNPQVLRMLAGYFEETAAVVGECARVVAPGGTMVMVNDNVRYEGVEVPVDLILCRVAEACGWHVEAVETVPGGKGNASQQMARYGRRELRKGVYRWRRR